jgi:hypothetical protein
MGVACQWLDSNLDGKCFLYGKRAADIYARRPGSESVRNIPQVGIRPEVRAEERSQKDTASRNKSGQKRESMIPGEYQEE